MEPPHEEKRARIVEIIRALIGAKESEPELVAALEELEHLASHPAPTDVIFWTYEDLSFEEMAGRSLAHRPLPLGP